VSLLERRPMCAQSLQVSLGFHWTQMQIWSVHLTSSSYACFSLCNSLPRGTTTYVLGLKNKILTRKGGNCEALQLEGRQSFSAIVTRTIMHQTIQIQHFCNLLWTRRTRSPLRKGYFGDWWAFTSIFGHTFTAHALWLTMHAYTAL